MSEQLGMFEEYPAVKVVRSARRRKTVEASQQNGVLRIVVPDRISAREEAHWVREFQRVAAEKRLHSTDQLREATESLASRFHLPKPKTVKWVANQKSRWAYCDTQTDEIGICEQVKEFPRWVIDYVIVHELVHLVEPHHSRSFWDQVNKFSKTERARGYLMAKSEDREL